MLCVFKHSFRFRAHDSRVGHHTWLGDFRDYRDIYGIVAQMKMGEGSPFVGRLGEMFSSCMDGKRPVIFQLERLDE